MSTKFKIQFKEIGKSKTDPLGHLQFKSRMGIESITLSQMTRYSPLIGRYPENLNILSKIDKFKKKFSGPAFWLFVYKWKH